MNQESFLAYKSQVYNPGSPYPNPSLSPVKPLLSKESKSPYSSTVNPENPLKITFSSSKRKRNSGDSDLTESPCSPKKKPKMMSQKEIEKMTENVFQKFLNAQEQSSKEMKES